MTQDRLKSTYFDTKKSSTRMTSILDSRVKSNGCCESNNRESIDPLVHCCMDVPLKGQPSILSIEKLNFGFEWQK